MYKCTIAISGRRRRLGLSLGNVLDEEIGCSLRLAGGSDDALRVITQHAEPGGDVRGMIAPRLQGKLQVSRNEG